LGRPHPTPAKFASPTNCETSTDSVIDTWLTLVDRPPATAAASCAKPGFMPLPKSEAPPAAAAASNDARSDGDRFDPVTNSALVTTLIPALSSNATSLTSKRSGL